MILVILKIGIMKKIFINIIIPNYLYGKFFFYPILAGGAVWASGKLPDLKNEVVTGIVVNVTMIFQEQELIKIHGEELF